MKYMKLPINQIELNLEDPRIKQWLEIYGDDIFGFFAYGLL